MSFHLPQCISDFFAHKSAAETVRAIDPVVTALMGVLHAFGLTGDHVNRVVGSVLATANDVTANLSGTQKLNKVAADVVELALNVGLERAAGGAKTIAQIGYWLAKSQSLIK